MKHVWLSGKCSRLVHECDFVKAIPELWHKLYLCTHSKQKEKERKRERVRRYERERGIREREGVERDKEIERDEEIHTHAHASTHTERQRE